MVLLVIQFLSLCCHTFCCSNFRSVDALEMLHYRPRLLVDTCSVDGMARAEI
jgi:hypothetical protein